MAVYQIDKITGGDSSRDIFVTGPDFDEKEGLQALVKEHVCVFHKVPSVQGIDRFISIIDKIGQIRIDDRRTDASIVVWNEGDRISIEFVCRALYGPTSKPDIWISLQRQKAAELILLFFSNIGAFERMLMEEKTVQIVRLSHRGYGRNSPTELIKYWIECWDMLSVVEKRCFMFFDLSSVPTTGS